jgi:hypothetical protein
MLPNLEYAIGKLRLALGDVLVLKMATNLTPEHVARCRADLTRILGEDAKVLVLDGKTELSILTRDEIEAKVGGLKLIDRARLVYQTEPGRQILAVRDGGHALTRYDTHAQRPTVPAGCYHGDPVTGEITLGSLPSGAVTCDLGAKVAA